MIPTALFLLGTLCATSSIPLTVHGIADQNPILIGVAFALASGGILMGLFGFALQ